MRVLVNAECTFRARAGIGHHTGELLRCLRKQAYPDAVGRYPAQALTPVNRAWHRLQSGYANCLGHTGLRAGLGRVSRRWVWKALRRAGTLLARDQLDFHVRWGSYDLYHEPNTVPLPCDLPTVATVHDLSVLLHPEWHPEARVAEYGRLFHAGLKQACHLLTVSEFAKAEIVRHLNWPADRVTVAYNGRRPHLRPLPADESAPVLRKLKLSPGYLLHVGTLEPRKNLALLLKAHAGLPAAVRAKHPLVLAGGTGWGANDLENAVAEGRRDGTVRQLGYVADAHLPALYSSARALVFPTLYEGFGMPTIEMLACGGAVLASTAGAVAETVGGQAHLTDPHDEGGWRDAMLRVCTDDDWRNELRAGAEDVAKPFTWERCADATLAAYRKALGQEAEIEVKRAA